MPLRRISYFTKFVETDDESADIEIPAQEIKIQSCENRLLEAASKVRGKDKKQRKNRVSA